VGTSILCIEKMSGNDGIIDASEIICTRYNNMTSAEKLIREVANHLGFTTCSKTGGDDDKNDNNNKTSLGTMCLDQICEEMRKEFIIEEWQLSTLDSYQWKQLGAPMGLAAAIRKLSSTIRPEFISADGVNIGGVGTSTTAAASAPPMSMRKKNSRREELSSGGSSLSSTSYSRPPMSIKKTNTIIPIPEQNPTEAAETVEVTIEKGMEDREDPEKGGTNNSSNKSCTFTNNKYCKSKFNGKPPVCIFTLGKSLREYPDHSSFSQSFPMTKTFQQAMLHGKSGKELKAHTVFVMELSVLASALFLGAAVEMWGAFPMDAVSDPPLPGELMTEPYVPRPLLIVYHFTSCALMINQLLCTSGWIWSLHATAAVSPEKFHRFMIMTRFPFSQFLKFSELGVLNFVVNICVLFMGMIQASTTNLVLRQIGYYLPFAVLLLGSVMVNNFASYIGRVAFHGMLLTDEEVFETAQHLSRIQDGAAKKAECEMYHHLHRESILSDSQALDTYHISNTKSWEPSDDDGSNSVTPLSIFDLAFQNSTLLSNNKSIPTYTTTTSTRKKE